MAVEIERKFLVDIEKMPELNNGTYISQGYIETGSKTVVRARIKGEKGFITLKGENTGMSCLEYEYEIPVSDAREIISSLCSEKTIDKTRYEYKDATHTWEIDVFHGENEGLVVVEVELSSESEQPNIPAWVSVEVTGQAKYYNSSLVNKPYSKWSDAHNQAVSRSFFHAISCIRCAHYRKNLLHKLLRL